MYMYKIVQFDVSNIYLYHIKQIKWCSIKKV